MVDSGIPITTCTSRFDSSFHWDGVDCVCTESRYDWICYRSSLALGHVISAVALSCKQLGLGQFGIFIMSDSDSLRELLCKRRVEEAITVRGQGMAEIRQLSWNTLSLLKWLWCATGSSWHCASLGFNIHNFLSCSSFRKRFSEIVN